MRELVAAYHDGDQAGHLGDGSGKQGLHRGETAIEGRAAHCVREYGRDNEHGEEAE
jgi:hypothetical protein